jgi:hypothetical protein
MFGVVGGFRGWAKEIIVLFSMILALFILYVLEKYVPGAREALAIDPTGLGDPGSQVLVRAGLILLLAYFGYQTPNIPIIAQSKFAREKLQDWLLGSVLGMVNGYFIVGSIWYYMHIAGYPWPDLISAPLPDSSAYEFIAFLPPKLLGEPYIFFAIGAAFVFVIIVFI